MGEGLIGEAEVGGVRVEQDRAYGGLVKVVLGGQDGPTVMSAALSGVAAAGRATDNATAKPDDAVRGGA